MDNSMMKKVRLFVDHLEDLYIAIEEEKGFTSINTNNGTVWIKNSGNIPHMTSEIYAITMIPVEDDCADCFLSEAAWEDHGEWIENVMEVE